MSERINDPQIDSGGGAFPCPRIGEDGMSLRDYFAAKAMQGLLASESGMMIGSGKEVVSKLAYKMADAMIEARQDS